MDVDLDTCVDDDMDMEEAVLAGQVESSDAEDEDEDEEAATNDRNAKDRDDDDDGDPLMALIGFQKASGAFVWGGAFETFCSLSKEDMRAKFAAAGDNDIWVIALAVAILETKFKEQRACWDLVADKARAFLADSGVGEEIIEKAKRLI